MPLYSYKCSSCGFIFDEFSSISKRNTTKKCPECLNGADRCILAEQNTIKDEDHERWSMSMGCTAVHAKEVLKEHPELESDFKFGKEGGPLRIYNREDKLRKMKIFGYTYEYD